MFIDRNFPFLNSLLLLCYFYNNVTNCCDEISPCSLPPNSIKIEWISLVVNTFDAPIFCNTECNPIGLTMVDDDDVLLFVVIAAALTISFLNRVGVSCV